uniref:Sulfotransferase n=1 Tax=Oryza meridionalis TaxID=40149 RepID=A0A0E0E9W1_9ORYZ
MDGVLHTDGLAVAAAPAAGAVGEANAEQVFDLFCDGRSVVGPQWHHVREFLRCPFTADEVAAGVVDAIVDVCSIDELKNMQAKKTGVTDLAVRKETFFRRGVAGEWSNHISSEMASRLDRVVEDVLRGSGFTFGAAVGDSE